MHDQRKTKYHFRHTLTYKQTDSTVYMLKVYFRKYLKTALLQMKTMKKNSNRLANGFQLSNKMR